MESPPTDRLPTLLLRIACLAAAYYVTARLGLLLAIPPGYAAPVWPPSGIALAGVLLYGYRVWPGIWLGSFAANLWISLHAAGTTTLLESSLPAAGIGAGAALQGLLGGFLVNRFVRLPITLDRETDILKFLLLAGPVSCLVNATCGVSGLLLAGTIQWGERLFSWGTWWAGDVIGVLAVVPLVLTLAAEPREIWRPRRASVGVPLCVIFALVVALYVFVSDREQERIKFEFERRTSVMAGALQRSLDEHIGVLHSIRSFFYANSDEVDRLRFRVFVKNWLERYAGIQALEWIPRVLHAEREAYENTARRDGFPDFRITERTNQGQQVVRARRREYFPAYYVEPYAGNEKALGFDLASDHTCLVALDEARATGKPVATGRISLIQESGDQFGFLILVPIYHQATGIDNPDTDELQPRSVQDRREALKGFAVGVFRAGAVLEAAVQGMDREGIEIRLYDDMAGEAERLLHDSRPGRQGERGLSQLKDRRDAPTSPWWVTSFEMAGRRWTVEFVPTPDYVAAHRSLQAWSVLAAGLLFSILASAFLLLMTGRATRIEQLVTERTAALEGKIIERKRMEETLHEGAELLKATLESTADGILVVNESGRVISTNTKFFEMWRIPRDLQVAKEDSKLLDLVLAQLQEPEAFLSKVQALYASSEEDFDTIHFRDGRVFERFSCPLIRDGKIFGRVWSFRDVTERKRAEEAIRENEEQFRTLVESAPDAIFIQAQGCFVYANKATLRLYGAKSAQELLGKPVIDRLHSGIRERIRLVNEERKPVPVAEQIHLKLDGTTIDVEVNVVPITYNKVDGGLVFVRDITERKRAEEALRITQFSVEHAADPIYWIGPEAQILYANEAACRSLGYTKEELLSLSVSDIDPDFSIEKWPGFYEQWKQDRFLTFESAHRRKDGTTFPIEVNVNNLAFDGRAFNLVFVRDISERKQAENQRQTLEAQLRQAQKMEAIGTLAGGIAHDFNNILAVIIGYTEMILLNVSEHNPMRDDLVQILKAGYRARDLVKQILVFSRMKTVEGHQSVNIGQVVEEALKFVRASLPTTIEIRQNIESKTGTTLADPTQIHELLINLCTNAAHAMEEKGGVLEVRLADVDLDPNATSLQPDTKAGPYLRLTVADTGHGMDTETIEHIFEPYFTTKEVGKGTGFGLAVVHGIVKRHGGAITVHSEPGKGTTFQIYLPSIEDTGRMEDEAEGPIPGGTERILFVDDEEMLANMAKTMLEQLGYQVLAQTSSIETLNIFRTHPYEFDLVVTDYTMPQMTGTDLAREMLSIRPDIPIILCTGFSENITEKQAKYIGIVEFMMKPFNRHSIATVVRKTLDKGRD